VLREIRDGSPQKQGSRDIRVPPARNLKGLACEVTGRFTFWEKCHGLRALARILAKLGSKGSVFESRPL